MSEQSKPMLTNPYMVHEFGTKFYVIGMYSIFMIATEFIFIKNGLGSLRLTNWETLYKQIQIVPTQFILV